MAYVICLDTEPETIETLRAEGHHVDTGETGYRTGWPLLKVPPHECDLLICDLRKPACFNATHWGPGRNDNFQCTIEKSINDSTFFGSGGRPRPVYELIHPSQMPPRPVGTFGPSDVFKAVDHGGVPMLLFLNPEWMRHVTYTSPNFVEVLWSFERTKATKLNISPLLKEVLPEIDDSVTLARPLEFHIVKRDHKPFVASEKFFSSVPLVTNIISQVFGEVILLEKGSIWALPQFTNNALVCSILLNRLDSFINVQSSLVISKGKPISPERTGQLQNTKQIVRDVFISHASEDKDQIARPLANALIEKGLSVWFDEYELTLGDSLRRKIEEGLRSSRFGVTILSHHFFSKRWPQIELDGLFALETGSKKILPVWHGVSEGEVRQYSPILADRLGISTSEGIEAVADAVLRAVKK